MKWKFILVLLAALCISSVNAQVHTFSDLRDINISQGESLILSGIITDVKIDGEDASVSVNFPDTSVLSSGHHDLVFTAVTFSGKTETKVVSLIVDKDAPLSSEPSISGSVDLSMTEGDRFNLLRNVSAVDSSGKNIPVFVSLKYPEHLNPGLHDIYYTAVDYNGNSKVVASKLNVKQLEMKYKKAEWAQLGNSLFEKYFIPSEFENDITDGITRYFTYSPAENGITAEIFINGIKYNTFELNSTYPGKLERLTARMVLFLNELKHHRIFWKDQQNIIFTLSEKIYDSSEYDFSNPDNADNPGARKTRGIYLFKIPVDSFRKDNAVQIIRDAFKSLSALTPDVEKRSDNGGKITKQHINLPDGGKIIFLQDLGSSLLSNHSDAVNNGTETFEETFDYKIFEDEWQIQYKNYLDGHFGTFTNPRLFFNEEGK
jgi:hypothetical protein